jgi:hypothetical protein
MRKFANCECQAGNISLKMKNCTSVHKLYGYVESVTDESGNVYAVLQPADLRRNPAMKIPVENIDFIIVEH